MSFYEKLPSDVLIQFYYEIQKNIDREILSDAMYHETSLIKTEANKRGIFLLEWTHRNK